MRSSQQWVAAEFEDSASTRNDRELVHYERPLPCQSNRHVVSMCYEPLLVNRIEVKPSRKSAPRRFARVQLVTTDGPAMDSKVDSTMDSMNGQHRNRSLGAGIRAGFSGWRAVCFAVHFGIQTGSIG